MYMRNQKGPSIEPWGTPHFRVHFSESTPLSGNSRLLRERLNKSVRTLLHIQPVALATSNFDSNFKTLDGLISVNTNEVVPRFKTS